MIFQNMQIYGGSSLVPRPSQKAECGVLKNISCQIVGMHVWEDPPPFSLNHFFLCSLSRLDVNTIVYKKGAIVVLAAEDDLPVFGETQHVVAVNVDQYYFVVVILHTVF